MMQNFSTCLWNGVDRIVDRSVGNFRCASTSFENLDRLIDGFRPGELTVVNGVPGIGKTTVVLSMLYRMASKNLCPVGYITTESQLSDVSDRLVQIAFDVNKDELQGLKRDDLIIALYRYHASVCIGTIHSAVNGTKIQSC